MRAGGTIFVTGTRPCGLVPVISITKKSILWLSALSLVGIPALFTLVYSLGYGSLFPSHWDLVWLGICILAGMWIIYRLPLPSSLARIAASGAYGLLMSGLFFFIALGVACGNDNCL